MWGKAFRYASVFVLALSSARTFAQSSVALGPYTWEVTPVIGINLPYDLWPPVTLKTFGLRGAWNLASAGGAGALDFGFFVQHQDPQRVYSGDFGYHYDFVQEGLNAFFAIGFHYSYFDLHVLYDGNGECIPANCETDTGNHSGLYVGGGIMIPLTANIPVKFAMKFYNSPQLWLLLEMGMGFRF